MEKAITTHIDITHSTRQSQNRLFFLEWSSEPKQICGAWIGWKTLHKYFFFVHFENLDQWWQLKSVPGGVDGEGELISWTYHCSLWYQDSIRTGASCQQPQITCEIGDLLWTLATFPFTLVVSSVLSLEMRLALEVCQLCLFWVSPLWEELDTLAWELLGTKKWSYLGAISSNVFRLKMQPQDLGIKFMLWAVWNPDAQVMHCWGVFMYWHSISSLVIPFSCVIPFRISSTCITQVLARWMGLILDE